MVSTHVARRHTSPGLSRCDLLAGGIEELEIMDAEVVVTRTDVKPVSRAVVLPAGGMVVAGLSAIAGTGVASAKRS